MPIKFKQQFDSLIFKPGKRAQVVSNALTRVGKRFKQKTKDQMVRSQPTGRLYRKSAGAGFTRQHRASAWGQRPAVDTTNLVNQVKDRKESQVSVRVYVDDSKAPYGKWLQDNLNRPIITEEDVNRFGNNEMKEEMERALRQLLK